MPIKIDFLSNVRDLLRGTKQAEDAFGDVSDSLDHVVKDGDTAQAQLERNFREIADASKDAGRKIDKNMADVGDAGHKGFHKASEAAGEFKGEALQNFSEVTSSFDGSMSSIGDVAQGTLGGVASSIPGIGIAAGVAAVGIGAITSTLQNLQDKAKAITDGIVADFIDMGDALDQQAVQSRVAEFFKSEETTKQAELLAQLLHVTVGQAALLMAGDVEAAGVRVEDVVTAIANAPGDVNYDTWIGLKNTVDATNKGLDYGAQAAKRMKDAMDRKATSDLKAAKATAAVTSEVDDLGNTIYHLPNGKEILVDADTGQATYDLESVASKTRNLPDGRITITADTRLARSAFEKLRQDLTSRGITVPVQGRIGKTWQ